MHHDGRHAPAVTGRTLAGAAAGLAAGPIAFGVFYLILSAAYGTTKSDPSLLSTFIWEAVMAAFMTTPAFAFGFAPMWIWFHRQGWTSVVHLVGLGFVVGGLTTLAASLWNSQGLWAAPFVLLFACSMAIAGLAVRLAAYGVGPSRQRAPQT